MFRLLRSWTLPLLLVLVIQGVASRGLLTDVPAPDVRGELVDGSIYPGLQPEGKPVLLYFWGSWCGICRAMQGTIQRVAQDHRVITVALRSGDRSEILAYMNAQNFSARTLADPTGEWGESFGVRGVPALFFIDRSGRIRSVTTGFTTEIGIRLRLWWLEGA